MFSVQYLKALYVLQLNTIGKRFPLEVNVWELWECSGCIWDVRTQDTHFISHYNITESSVCIKYIKNKYKASSLLSSPRNCWYCWTWVLMSTCPDPCCCCCCWPAPAAVPLVIPSTLCTGFNLIRMQKEVIVVKLSVTFDPCPDQAPDTFFHPWTTTHWCGNEVTGMERRFDYSGF